MVLQDTWLFTGTIADNIAYGRPDASRDEVLAAARAAYVDRFVQTLPDGYDTVVSDDGGAVSAGEKQLITIVGHPGAAAIAGPGRGHQFGRHQDGAADPARDGELRRDRTSFIIAHRLSTIRDADLIVVLDAAGSVERGTHAEPLARRGAYRGNGARLTGPTTVPGPVAQRWSISAIAPRSLVSHRRRAHRRA